MQPLGPYGLLASRRRANVAPPWADDAIHREAPDAPTLSVSQDGELIEEPEYIPPPPSPSPPPPRRPALYQYAMRKHAEAVRNIEQQGAAQR